MNIILPYLISLLIGYFFTDFLLKKRGVSLSLRICLAAGIGLSISAEIVFYSFILFNQFHKGFVLCVHGVLLIGLFCARYFFSKQPSSFLVDTKEISRRDYAWIFLLLSAFVLSFFQANLYPFGGWDAWSVWNLKAKFLFVNDTEWKKMFDPLLWRSSPHYPLLLPLINVWGWIFLSEPSSATPLATSLVFTFLTVAFLFFSLKIFIKNIFAFLAAFLILTLPYFVKLTTDQYSDILVAYFILTSLVCSFVAVKKKIYEMLFCAGLCLGFLSFVKVEGLAAGMMMICLIMIYIFFQNDFSYRRSLILLLGGFGLAALPSLIFYLFYAPQNQTFINGLASQTQPSDFTRLKIIASFFILEIKSPKWSFIWPLLLAGIGLGFKNCFRRDIIILPIFFGLYLGVTAFYYFLNTYFEIGWWLSVTLSRILLSILPAVIFWIFYSLWQEEA